MSGKCEDSETWHRAALRTPVVPRRTFTLCSSLENVPEKCAVPGFVFCLSQRRSALCWEQALLSAGISVGPKPRGCEPPGYSAGGGGSRGGDTVPHPSHHIQDTKDQELKMLICLLLKILSKKFACNDH